MTETELEEQVTELVGMMKNGGNAKSKLEKICMQGYDYGISGQDYMSAYFDLLYFNPMVDIRELHGFSLGFAFGQRFNLDESKDKDQILH